MKKRVQKKLIIKIKSTKSASKTQNIQKNRKDIHKFNQEAIANHYSKNLKIQ